MVDSKHDGIAELVAATLNLPLRSVTAVLQLLDSGNTIPFIARYRKEATNGLDERQLRAIEDAAGKARELAGRKATILKTISELGLLTPELRQKIEACQDRDLLEDLYLPYRPKRRTRAAVARERGLQPLADLLLKQQRLSEPATTVVQRFVSTERDVPDCQAALDGACDIVAETWAEIPEIRQWITERTAKGQITAAVKRGQKEAGERFAAWFDYQDRVDRMPTHRFLALKRGEAEGVLRLSVSADPDDVLPRLERRLISNDRFEFADRLKQTVHDCYERLLQPAAESSVMAQLKAKADAEAIDVFAKNLRELLLAAPAGPKVTLGVDPGFRTGCKLAVVDETGRFLEHATIYPTPPKCDAVGAAKTLVKLIQAHNVQLIAIGNGTASRETDAFVGSVLKDHAMTLTKVMVSESGASIYSASELAISEYPDLDVTVRGAISIAHRLQDPLAELVKIDPQSIGVGQYQHDVNQTELKKALDREVESCVNSVGVDVNLASQALLTYVAGIGPVLAQNILMYRNEVGTFQNRRELLKVPRLGAKAFEQAAGFLRIRGGSEPLDNSAVHPESYPLVTRMASSMQMKPADLIGKRDVLNRLRPEHFVSDDAGLFTVSDILSELAAPGRDPRSEFKAVAFDESVQSVSDLTPGMKLEGVVTNVTHFGAFVDIGVHQDGLIHISQLANHFVKDPAMEVKVGDIVKVTVLEVDEQRKRISLSRKSAPM
ncbi:MAG: Tex family protein [Planctomycetaceae bacterium]